MEDYLDEDVGYLLGMIIARGTIREEQIRQIIIEIPFKNLEAIGVKTRYEQKDKILISLDSVVDRISELSECNVRKVSMDNCVQLVIETLKNSMFWRNIKLLTKEKKTYYEFEIPEQIFQSNENIKKEFVKGFADVGGSARWSNRYIGDRCRVYLDVLYPNWKLPIQLCNLLQQHLQIPVQTIAWGHPSIRDPSGEKYKKGQKEFWAKEHQVKIFAEAFLGIGFGISHKQAILEELAEFNKSKFSNHPNFCNQTQKFEKKPKLKAEKSEKLPMELRGKHYNGFSQICRDLGCKQPQQHIVEV